MITILNIGSTGCKRGMAVVYSRGGKGQRKTISRCRTNGQHCLQRREVWAGVTWEGTASDLDLDSLRVHLQRGERGETPSVKGEEHKRRHGSALAGWNGSGSERWVVTLERHAGSDGWWRRRGTRGLDFREPWLEALFCVQFGAVHI